MLLDSLRVCRLPCSETAVAVRSLQHAAQMATLKLLCVAVAAARAMESLPLVVTPALQLALPRSAPRHSQRVLADFLGRPDHRHVLWDVDCCWLTSIDGPVE